MNVTRIDIGLLRVPLKVPFKTALRSVEELQEVVVLIHTDGGRTGFGAAPPTAAITGETTASITEAVHQHIAPRLIGQPVARLNRNLALVHSALVHNSSARAAVEIALYDLWAQWHGAPLYQLLGGGEPALVTDVTISVNPVEMMVNDALAAVKDGFSQLKIKLGQDARLDVERVRAVHAAVKGRAQLRLDANQGWEPRQAVQIMHALERGAPGQDGLVFELLEQPVKADDIDGLHYVAQRIDTPLMADESVFGPRAALTVLARKAADIINIKLMKAGGLSRAIQIADIAALHDAPCMLGCMLESAISVTAAAHLAVARAEVITKIDLDGPSLCQFNPVHGGAVFDGANIRLTDAPGLGIAGVSGLQMME